MVDYILIIDKDGHRRGRIWHHQDITGRKQVENELQNELDLLSKIERTLLIHENRLLMAQDIGHTGCWEYSFETDQIWGSAEALRFYGFPPISGYYPIEEIEACVEDRDRVQQAFADFIAGKREYDLEITANPRNGSPQRIVRSIARSEKDEQDKPVRVIRVLQDITEQKIVEGALKIANEKLHLLSSITRHDILNQITALRSYLLLAEDIEKDPEKLDIIKKEQQIAFTIEEQILFTKDYQTVGIRAPAWQNVKESFLRSVRSLPMGSVKIEIDRSDFEILADPLFDKVFYNVIENSLRHGGDTMNRIRLSCREDEQGLVCSCEDNGVGIPRDDKPLVFERGFGKHTGHGMFLTREILNITGITISEQGEFGKGVRFEIVVPKGAYRSGETNQRNL